MTTCFNFIRRTASATRCGSSSSSANGFAVRDRAKSAGARATFARDHHRRGALAPAFPAIRTLRAFADGVQAQIGDERLGRKENRIRGQTHFDPGRLVAPGARAGSIFAQDIAGRLVSGIGKANCAPREMLPHVQDERKLVSPRRAAATTTLFARPALDKASTRRRIPNRRQPAIRARCE